jgi:hypothetical protein
VNNELEAKLARLQMLYANDYEEYLTEPHESSAEMLEELYQKQLEQEYLEQHDEQLEMERRAKYYPADTLESLMEKKRPPIKEYVNKLIAAGCITIVAGDPKAGKSTLLFHALSALTNGEPFLWGTSRPVPILYATEQSEVSFQGQIQKEMNFSNAVKPNKLFRQIVFEENRMRSELVNPPAMVFPPTWNEQIRLWKAAIEKNQAKVFVIDTFTAFAQFRGGESFDPGVVHTRGQALKELLVGNPDLAIVVLHHLRKEPNIRGGDNVTRSFSDIANSYALRAFSDTNVLIYKTSPNAEDEFKRTLVIEGRLTHSQLPLIIELTKNGFVDVTPKIAPKKEESSFDKLLRKCIQVPDATNWSIDRIIEEWGFTETEVRNFRRVYNKGHEFGFGPRVDVSPSQENQ